MAISIKYIHDMVFFVVDKRNHKKQRRADIDLAAYEASIIVFNEYKQQYEATNTISEYMSVFEKTETFSSIISPNGSYIKPSDYNRYVLIQTDDGIPVEVLLSAEWNKRRNHPIKPPSSEYPIARIGDRIYVLPEATKIDMVYWKNPQKPEYKENTSGDYDPTSTGLEWNMDLWPKICNLILGKLGINLNEQQVIEYSELQKRQ